MPTFFIEERVPCTHVWTYKIEAATEEEAMDLIYSGKAETLNSSHEDYNYDETEWNVEEAENDRDNDNNEHVDTKTITVKHHIHWEEEE